MKRSVRLINLLVILSLIAGLASFAAVSFNHQSPDSGIAYAAADPQTQPLAASDVVYVTRTGEKYHKSGCRYLSQSKIKTTRAQAEKDGYTACKVCKP